MENYDIITCFGFNLSCPLASSSMVDTNQSILCGHSNKRLLLQSINTQNDSIIIIDLHFAAVSTVFELRLSRVIPYRSD